MAWREPIHLDCLQDSRRCRLKWLVFMVSQSYNSDSWQLLRHAKSTTGPTKFMPKRLWKAVLSEVIAATLHCTRSFSTNKRGLWKNDQRCMRNDIGLVRLRRFIHNHMAVRVQLTIAVFK